MGVLRGDLVMEGAARFVAAFWGAGLEWKWTGCLATASACIDFAHDDYLYLAFKLFILRPVLLILCCLFPV
jgi:hypothetical protein